MKWCQINLLYFQFAEAFAELEKEESGTPNDEDIVSVAESVCDDSWEG